MRTYLISYSYNNGTTMTEKVSATSGIKALKKARAYTFLHDAMFQAGSKCCNPDAALCCYYTDNGKWHATYFEF